MASELEAASLEAKLSLIDDEYYGERTEESEVDIDKMSSERDSSESESESELVVMHLTGESSDLDTKEVEIVKKFKYTSCGCKKKDGLLCSDYFSEEDISQLRMAMAELEPD